MRNNPPPGIRRRLLAKELVRLREESGTSFDDVVEELGFSKSKMSRIEAALIGVSIVDARALAHLYGAAEEIIAKVDRYARVAKQRGWWHVYGKAMETWFGEFVVLESEATGIDEFEIDLIPGLFQTPAYARWTTRAFAPDAPDELIDQRAELRQTRQRRVENGSITVWAIVDEAALRRVVGDARVHTEQLQHLLKLAELPNVTLQVLPFAKGQHIAMGTAFSMLNFADYPSVVFIENLTGAVYLEEQSDVERYTLVLDHLRATALDPFESVAVVKQVIADM
jgi:transcriptional regulator with XRE-family HTH domain